MQIQNLFERDIFRPINGVVKVDQLDNSSVWQELDEFVVTKELASTFESSFQTTAMQSNSKAIRTCPARLESGSLAFSVQANLISSKYFPTLLRNRTHTHDGQSKKAVEFFENKIKDPMLFGDIKRGVASNTDVILFNIDSKAIPSAGREAILAVFLRVLNEMQGYSGDYPHIAHMERYLESKDKLKKFKDAFRNARLAPGNGPKNGMLTTSIGMTS